MTQRGSMAFRLAAAFFLALVATPPAWGLEPAPDQRDPKHLRGPLDPALYRFEPAEFTRGLPPVALQGPAKAKGLVIWNHGRDVAAVAPATAPPLAWEFARAGWDVYAQARLGTHDVRDVANRIIAAGIEQGRTLGYRRILLMGQSAGGFLALETLSRGALANGLVALAPAAYPPADRGGNDWRLNETRTTEFLRRLGPQRVSIALAYFADDPYFERSEPGKRAAIARQELARARLPYLVVGEPPHAGMRGHNAGLGLPFARRYTACILLLAESEKTPACEDGDRSALASFGLLPAAAIRSANDAFAGLWQGTSGTGRFVAINIALPGNDGARQMQYMLGRGMATEAAETQALPLKLSGNGLLFEQSPLRFELLPQPDGSLLARRIDSRKPNEPPNETRLQRLN